MAEKSDGYLQRGRPGRLRGRDFNPGDFPFDAFEFEERDKNEKPVIKVKKPWELDLNGVTQGMFIGYEGTGDPTDPDEGDRRVYIDGDEISFQEYTNGDWSSVNQVKLGGVDGDGVFAPFLSCRGIYNPLADIPDSEVFPAESFRIFNFENDLEDQHGVDDWDTKLLVGYSSDIKKFGTYSLISSTSSNKARLYSNESWTPGTDQAAGAYIYIDEIGASIAAIPLHLYAVDGSSNIDSIYLQPKPDGLRLSVTKGNTTTNRTVCSALELDEWHYLALVYDASEDTVYVVVDNTIYEESTFSGTWGTPINSYIAVEACLAEYDTTFYLDEVLFSLDTTIDPDVFVQHYQHNVAWNTDYSSQDLALISASGGEVKANGYRVLTTNDEGSGNGLDADTLDGAELSTDGTLGDNSDTAVPTEKAVKTYVDNNAGGGVELPGDVLYLVEDDSYIEDGDLDGEFKGWKISGLVLNPSDVIVLEVYSRSSSTDRVVAGLHASSHTYFTDLPDDYAGYGFDGYVGTLRIYYRLASPGEINNLYLGVNAMGYNQDFYGHGSIYIISGGKTDLSTLDPTITEVKFGNAVYDTYETTEDVRRWNSTEYPTTMYGITVDSSRNVSAVAPLAVGSGWIW